MEISIRPAALEDAPALAALVRGMGQFRWMEETSPAEVGERVARHLAQCLTDDSHSVFVAEGADGALLGFCSVHWLPYLIMPGPEGYVSELFVSPSARGLGAGSALLEAAEKAGREHGCFRLMLVNMRQRESYQRGFYKKHGWREREEAANFVIVLTGE